MDWGGDFSILIRMYRSLVRSKLDYGCVVYGSARKSYLRILEPIQNQGLRLCLGAFRTSPIDSLHVQAGEVPLHIRREKLALDYISKVSTDPHNPAYDCIFEPSFKTFFDSKPKAIPPLGIRMQDLIDQFNINPDLTCEKSVLDIPPWLISVLQINTEFSLKGHLKES